MYIDPKQYEIPLNQIPMQPDFDFIEILIENQNKLYEALLILAPYILHSFSSRDETLEKLKNLRTKKLNEQE